MRLSTKIALASSTLLALGPTAEAGVVAKQTMQSRIGDKSIATSHTWSIDGDKFHLAVAQGSDETQYVFNGKTLYVCGKLDERQMKAFAADPKLLEPFRQGACQVVPSNFMVRFFLSPQLAVESVDASDGLKLTLAVSDYKLTPPEAKGATVAGRECSKVTRSFAITKSGGAAEFGAAAEEALCQVQDVRWRGGIGKEVGKTVLRQPGGGGLMKLLKNDQDQLPGLVLAAQIKQSFKDQGGKKYEASYDLTTTSIKETALDGDLFKLPAGFRLFSPEGLDLAKLGTAKPATAGAAKEDSLLDLFQSAFFCSIAGRLGCFSN